MSVLLFANELYALPILRPLQAAADLRGLRSAWVVTDEIAARLGTHEQRLTSLKEGRQLNPEAVFCAANWVPATLPGYKVQVFHGFSTDKRPPEKGHFRIRGFFDLYCTHGPSTTRPFQALARRYRYFAVQETGWSKMDPLFQPASMRTMALRAAAGGRPCVMYASTFTPRLSAAAHMLETLTHLVARGDRHWLLTLHPKCSPDLFAAYRQLATDYPNNASFVDSEHLLDMLHAADVLVCDTSSVIDEMVVQLKPVVTIRNRIPKPFMLDVQSAGDVDAAVVRALQQPDDLMQRIRAHVDDAHPYRDGRSSERVLDAVDALARGDYAPLSRKPLNLVRRWKTRRRLPRILPG